MLISFNWLKQYIDLPDSASPEEVAEKLKMSTVEVEKIERLGAGLEGIVVGKVLSAAKHPNADKLKVCKVDVGSEHLQIVCGGSNVKEGMYAAVARLGARVRWHGEGEPIEMKEAEIRGVKSYGMICASTEIGLGELYPPKEEKEILDLTEKLAKPRAGDALDKALKLDDVILEVDNKSLSHRPDLWGHYGMAREVAALYKKDLKKYAAAEIKKPSGDIGLRVKVLDKKLCPRYMAVAVTGVKVGPSPAWLVRKLSGVGLRPINNIVDITNYVMYDLGEPMHAFDAERISARGGKRNITVRAAAEGEVFRTLDGKEHRLDTSMLVIAEDKKAVALAGIMGGEESGITDATTTVIFEAANFDAGNVRQTSTKLGMRTDSSARFEKGLDPNLCELALRKAVEMTLVLCPGARVASSVADEKHFRLRAGPLELPLDYLRAKLGAEVPAKEAAAILERLGFEVKAKKKALSVRIPTWRATKDIALKEDLVEEIARIYGYDNIPSSLPSFVITPPQKNEWRVLENKARDILSGGAGYTEVYNYSFVGPEQIKNLGDGAEKYLELDNPLSKERPFLRRHLVAGLMENLKMNLERYPEVKIFEIGKVFDKSRGGARERANDGELLPRQDTHLCAVFAAKKDAVPFWEMRQVLAETMNGLDYNWTIAPLDKIQVWEHPARLLLVSSGAGVVGVLSEMSPATCANFGVDYRVAMMDINLSELVSGGEKKGAHYHTVPMYPEVTRDIAFVVDAGVAHADIARAMKEAGTLVKDVELFDVYAGENIGAGKKSVAYRVTLARSDHTLTSAEADAAMETESKMLADKFGAQVRK